MHIRHTKQHVVVDLKDDYNIEQISLFTYQKQDIKSAHIGNKISRAHTLETRYQEGTHWKQDIKSAHTANKISRAHTPQTRYQERTHRKQDIKSAHTETRYEERTHRKQDIKSAHTRNMRSSLFLACAAHFREWKVHCRQ